MPWLKLPRGRLSRIALPAAGGILFLAGVAWGGVSAGPDAGGSPGARPVAVSGTLERSTPSPSSPFAWLLPAAEEGSAVLPAAVPTLDAQLQRPRECQPWLSPGPPREFHFTRGIYNSGGGAFGFRRRGRAWCTDHPKAEEQFLEVVDRLTGLDAHPWGNAIRLDDPELRRFPILYMLEVGSMGLTAPEVEGLRSYLLAGGFLIIDDFWGTREWYTFEQEMRQVLPEHPIVELPMDHPVYRTFYQVDTVLQVPAVNRAWGGPTWEQDGYDAMNYGIFDDDGRLMVVINWNTDLGDAWEWMEQPHYPLRFSTYAYQVGVNYLIHAMSH